MNNKQRAYLSSLASDMNAILQIGKNSLTPECIEAVNEALNARELIKISVLKNCDDDTRSIAEVISERTHSQIVRVIGHKIILYKAAKNPKIKLPE